MLQRAPDWTRIEAAAAVIGADVRDTPVLSHAGLDRAVGARVLLKDESRGPIGSFKARGTDYFVATAVEPGVELVCASAGNFGQGLARSGRARGHTVTVFAATTANPLKIARMRALGAEVRLEGIDFDAARAGAMAYAAGKPGALYIEDSESPEIAEGAGTVARELTEAGLAFDAFFVPIGGGALANGCGAWLRHARPNCKIIGVGAAGAPANHASWKVGRALPGGPTKTIADGIAIREPAPYAIEHLAANIDDFVLVGEDQMLAAMRLLHSALGIAVEPSGAAALAAMIAYKLTPGATVAGVLSGGNVTDAQKKDWFA